MKTTLTRLSALFCLTIASHTAIAAPISINQSTDGIVAKVNDEIILKSELVDAMNVINAQAHASGVNLSEERIQQEALDALILRKLQLGIIKRADLTANNELIDRQLLSIAQAQGFKTLEELQSSLDAKQAGSYAKLRQEVIEESALSALAQHSISNRVKISNQEINAFLASPEARTLNQDEYRTIHIRVPYVGNTANPTNAQQQEALAVALRVKTALENGQTYQEAMLSARGNYIQELQGADTGYNQAKNLPNELTNIITNLAVGAVRQPIITPTGVDVVMLTGKRAANQIMIPEWHTSHILVRVDASQNSALAKQKIDELYASLQQGANFESLAATYSDDTASATQRGVLGWVNEGQMVPEFEAVMKNTERGDFSAPFTTQYGWHILRINDTRQRDATEQYRRARAEEILFNRMAPQAREDWLQELRSSAYIKIMQ